MIDTIKRSKFLTQTFGKDEWMRKHLVLIGTGLVCGVIGFFTSFYGGFHHTQATPATEKVVSAPAPAPAAPIQQVASVCEDKKHTVKEGESLWRIAEHEYNGRGYLWQLIAEDNNITKYPYVIQPDQVLNIRMSLCDLKPVQKQAKVVHVTKNEKPKATVLQPSPVAPIASSPTVPQTQAPVSNPAPQVAATPVPSVPPAPPVANPAPSTQPAPAAGDKKEERPQIDLSKAVASASRAQTSSSSQETKPETLTLSMQETEVPFVPTAAGSVWNSFETSPIEPGNRVDYFHADLGLVLARLPGDIQVVPYVALNTAKDTQHLPWDNKVKGEAGVKLSKPFARGMIDLGAGYAVENRLGGDSRSGPTFFTDGWFGHDEPTPSNRTSFVSSLPGNFWWNVGTLSPFERGNVLALGRVEQGFTLVKAKSISLIPDAWVQAGFDTQNKPWNNRYLYGYGGKIAIPWKTGIFSITGGWECVQPHNSSGTPTGVSSCGPKVSFDVWTGGRRKIGGR